MDTKNIIAAISLSLAIIVMWSLFFQPSPEEIKKRKEKEKIVNSSDAPNIDTTEKITNLSREEALKLDDRFYFEIQRHNDPGEKYLEKYLLSLSKKFKVPEKELMKYFEREMLTI